MAYNIPLPGLPGDSLLKGLMTGSRLYSAAMEPRLKREQLAQLHQHHLDQLELQKAAAGRAAASEGRASQLFPLQLQQLQQTVEQNDPAYLQKIIDGYYGDSGQVSSGAGQSQEPTQSDQIPSYMPSIGGFAEDYNTSGMFPVPQMNKEATTGFMPTGPASPSMPTQPGIGGHNWDEIRKIPQVRGWIKKHFGYDPAAETSEEKRIHSLADKIQLEQEKTNQKKKALEDKEKVAVEKDIPTIENSLQGVNELLKIARDNPDIFGHSFMPERYAKTSKNKNFGKWQNLIADRIAGLEGKLSSKGNVVALKMAASLKPSHAENQNVAIGKLESMKDELQKQLQRARDLTGKKPQYNDSDLVVVRGPNGEQTMTYAEAKRLGAE